LPSTTTTPLLPEKTLVEGELLTLEDVTIDTAALAGPGGDDGVETTSLELLLQSALDLAGGLEAVSLLLLDGVGLLLLLLLLGTLGLPPAAKSLAVVGLEPLPEGSGVDLDNSGLGQGVGADELVVGGMVDDSNDTGLLGDALGAPGVVAGVETESAELAVAATGADKMDALATNTGIGWLATLLESPKAMLNMTCRSDRVMHTSSCGSMRASHRTRSACDESRERYCNLSAFITQRKGSE
jgi:hypothetical protein